MKEAIKTGVSFGLTSGTITTLGLMVGLFSGTHSRMVVLGGILIIAVADAMSDALGIHIAEESEGHHSEKQIWAATGSAFFTKFLYTLTFVIPVLLFSLKTAIFVSIVYGLIILGVLSWKIAKKKERAMVMREHLVIAIIVIALTYFVGSIVGAVFV